MGEREQFGRPIQTGVREGTDFFTAKARLIRYSSQKGKRFPLGRMDRFRVQRERALVGEREQFGQPIRTGGREDTDFFTTEGR